MRNSFDDLPDMSQGEEDACMSDIEVSNSTDTADENDNDNNTPSQKTDRLALVHIQGGTEIAAPNQLHGHQ
ncbi:hypothetical protein BGZ73_001892, partial [Actinomortierella ambigua]